MRGRAAGLLWLVYILSIQFLDKAVTCIPETANFTAAGRDAAAHAIKRDDKIGSCRAAQFWTQLRRYNDCQSWQRLQFGQGGVQLTQLCSLYSAHYSIVNGKVNPQPCAIFRSGAQHGVSDHGARSGSSIIKLTYHADQRRHGRIGKQRPAILVYLQRIQTKDHKP